VGPGGALVVTDEDAARLDERQDASGRAGVHLAVEWHDDRAELPQREEVDRRAPVAGQPEHDAVARADAAGGQLSGQAIGERQQLAARNRAPA
jgi:hypothetical protein